MMESPYGVWSNNSSAVFAWKQSTSEGNQIGQNSSEVIKKGTRLVLDPSDTSASTVVHGVRHSYNDFGQLHNTWQEHSGAVDTGSSHKVVEVYQIFTNTSGLLTDSARLVTYQLPESNHRLVPDAASTSFGWKLSRTERIFYSANGGTNFTQHGLYQFNGAGGRLVESRVMGASSPLSLARFDSGAANDYVYLGSQRLIVYPGLGLITRLHLGSTSERSSRRAIERNADLVNRTPVS